MHDLDRRGLRSVIGRVELDGDIFGDELHDRALVKEKPWKPNAPILVDPMRELESQICCLQCTMRFVK